MRLIELFEAWIKPDMEYLDDVNWDDERYKDIFTRAEYDHDPKGERVFIQFSSTENSSYNAIKKALENALPKNVRNMSFTLNQYIRGKFSYDQWNNHTQKWQSRNEQKVIAFLTHKKQGYDQNSDIIKNFVNDPIRDPKKKVDNMDNKYWAIISRNPHDIERMTAGRDWKFQSCMNLTHPGDFQLPSYDDYIDQYWSGNDDELKDYLGIDDDTAFEWLEENGFTVEEYPDFYEFNDDGIPIDIEGYDIEDDIHDWQESHGLDAYNKWVREKLYTYYEDFFDMEGWNPEEQTMGRDFIPMDIEHGTIIAYCTTVRDPDIKNPVARVLAKPFVSEDKEDLVYLGMEDSVYGKAIPNFVETVKEWVDGVNARNEISEVIEASLHKNVYNDGMKHTSTLLFPNEYSDNDKEIFQKIYRSPSDIDKLADKVSPERKEELQTLAIRKGGWDIIKLLDRPSDQLQMEAYKKIIEYEYNPINTIRKFMREMKGKTSDKIKQHILKHFPQFTTLSDCRNYFSDSELKQAEKKLEEKIYELMPAQVNVVIERLGDAISDSIQQLLASRYPEAIIKYKHKFSEDSLKIAYNANRKYLQSKIDIPIPEGLNSDELDILDFLISTDIPWRPNINNRNGMTVRPEYHEFFEILAVMTNPKAIKDLDSPSEKVQKIAIEKQPSIIVANTNKISSKMTTYGTKLAIGILKSGNEEQISELIQPSGLSDEFQGWLLQYDPTLALDEQTSKYFDYKYIKWVKGNYTVVRSK